MRHFCKNEKGNTIVEATMILPFCFVMIMLLYLVSVYLCQKANLQANLHTALIYFKNPITDNNVGVIDASSKDVMSFSGDVNLGDGSTYDDREDKRYMFPYRNLWVNSDEDNFKKFFRQLSGYMFFDDGNNIEIECKVNNYIVYKTLSAKASQTFSQPLSLRLIKGSGESEAFNNWDIVVEETVVITNSDDIIRDVDFVIDIVKGTKFGEKINEYISKGKDIYDKFYNLFHK